MPPESSAPHAEGQPEPPDASDASDAPDAPDAPSPPPSSGNSFLPTREYRAQWTFILATAFLVFAYVVVLSQSGGSLGGGLVLAGALGIGVNATAAWGLSNRRDWARYAMTPLLWIYVVAGVLVFVIVAARGGINIPVGTILAAWALLAKPSEALGPLPASSTEGTLLILGGVVAALIQFL